MPDGYISIAPSHSVARDNPASAPKGLAFGRPKFPKASSGVEHLGDYRPGGYRPIHLDDRLDNRYRIVHKLGHGTFSTVWLAVDNKTSKYVAVKVGTADAPRTEIDVLSQLTQNETVHMDFEGELRLIPVVLDRFDLSGPNGSSLFQLDAARSLAAQLAMAACLVHAQGYAHGDLHLGNLLLQLPASLNNLSIRQLYAGYGEPEQEPVVRLDTQAASTEPGVPSYAVPPVWLGIESKEIILGEAKLLLSDFGVAFRPSDNSRFESYTPLVYRPPEAFFEPTTPLTFASDIWSLGCVIFELLAHRSLIDGFLAPQDEITAQQVELQGLMPPEWWTRWEKRPNWYDEVGKPLSNASDIWSWERRFEQWVQNPRQSKGMEKIGDHERDALLKLLAWMLAWRPSERPSVRQVLETEWRTRWALPAARSIKD
ncbi:hypothetical protein JDV02_008222 [Purpureocillium takamizusanense]|uniref:Protein kinase domain-containing protein n=1 Tax=Purpureocillium takamizusanense TaxID=2060973 RepID=A0A9Q8VE58_9HYPO|nr:uncharacterized protein JDV02_008222 [Purpureocillium takamizusanense]UNI22323.1 hypothetical protein JDV02_008222 [Purpureocillium takamizusanense]